MKSALKIIDAAVLAVVGFVLGYVGRSWARHDTSSTNPSQTLQELTPDIVVARCGKPLNMTTTELTGDIEKRVLMYHDPALGQIVMIFNTTSRGFETVMEVSGDGSARQISDPAAQIAALPCLQTRPDPEKRVSRQPEIIRRR